MSGLEIERKFLVANDSYKSLATSSAHIKQGYICSERGRTVRVRLRDSKAFLTIKGPSLDGGLSRYEFEKEITPDEAEHLFLLCERGIIDKRRYLVPSGPHMFEVDEVYGASLSEEEKRAKPSFIGKEVTGDRRYYNSQLSQRPYVMWREE